ncbi:MAG: SGNH/GDSL hydrolase family protein [Chloroflexota bacterium]
MTRADPTTYLLENVAEMMKPGGPWYRIACHGHSVPGGHTVDPLMEIDTAYPMVWRRKLIRKFPFRGINVIVTAVGGENSPSGAERFERDVLAFNPSIVTIDYAVNDRGCGLQKAEVAWRQMIEQSLERQIKVLLLTPTFDVRPGKEGTLVDHVRQIVDLADEYEVGLVDSYQAFTRHVENGGYIGELMSVAHHPSDLGHELVARELMRWFPVFDVLAANNIGLQSLSNPGIRRR